MATTTPNFGWQVPTSTDYVKDGAAAIETLGDAIDASLVDLKGGTTGQVLSKNTNADMDFVWINNDQGDITAVTAGTGITGGGTSGAVTITNDMATTITASGDIIVGTGSGTYDNLPIGTTGQVLTADTTVSPYKVKWASAAAAAPTLNEQIFTSSGTFSVPSGITKVWVHMRGGGGGGASTYQSGYMGGSGSGGFMVDKQITVTSGGSVTVTIGAGGAGGASTGNNDGSTGGTTSFGAESATGGAGGKNRVVQLSAGSNNSVNGGGNGGAQGANGTGNAASANSGAGGSGSTGAEFAGGAGGSGIVIVRWLS